MSYQYLQTNIQHLLEKSIPESMVENVKTIVEKNKPYVNIIQNYYQNCLTHLEFLNKTTQSIRTFLTKNSVEFTYSAIEAASSRLLPILENFKTHNEATENASQAILYLILEYINSSPFNYGLKVENSSKIALYSVQAFVAIFSSAIVVTSGIKKVLE